VTALALVLVLSSAVTHATWNLLAKRVEGGAPFVWLFEALSTVICAPIVVVLIAVQGLRFGTAALGLVMVSSTLHTGYFVALSKGYRAGDLSLVYPLARGTGPLLATAGAIVILGERPHPIVVTGALLVVAGAVILGVNPRQLFHVAGRHVVALALITGGFIAAYTLIDKEGVSRAGASPFLYGWGLFLGSSLWLSPIALRRRDQVKAMWRAHAKEALGIAILSPISYVLVLSALVFTAVSYVAPAREIGVLMGAILGFHFLGEGHVVQRLSAATLMVTGIILLAL
jgi:drug/metabolite transporter (DMT)-like permease